MHLSLRYRNALHLANTYARTETSRAGKQTVIEKSGLDREFKNCSPFSLSVLNSVIDVFLITFSQTHLAQFSCKRLQTVRCVENWKLSGIVFLRFDRLCTCMPRLQLWRWLFKSVDTIIRQIKRYTLDMRWQN